MCFCAACVPEFGNYAIKMQKAQDIVPVYLIRGIAKRPILK